jgi:hypothetical protein
MKSTSRMFKAFLLGELILLLVLMLAAPAGAGTITIGFDSVPVDSTGFGNPSAYLAGFGITLSYTFPVSQVAQLFVGDDRFIYDTGDPTPSVVQAPSPHNIVSQGGSNGPITFTLHFSTPLESFVFTRVLAFPGAPPTSHPAWAAVAFDADDNEIASVSEGFSLNGTPATFTLSAASPSITRVTFFRDGTRGTASVNFTAFSHVLTDNWVLTGPGVGVIEVPFAAFNAKVEIMLGPLANDDAFEVKATFTLGAGSNGIDPLTEDVSFQVGTFSTTIPAGSFHFKPAKPGKHGKPGKLAQFTFEGVIDGVAVEAKITPLGANSFEFKTEGQGADLTGTANPVTLGLTIGDDGGSTTATAEFE